MTIDKTDATRGPGRLSATQRLTLHGFGILAAVLAAGFLIGVRAPRAVATTAGGGIYTGTAVRSQLRSFHQPMTKGELELVTIKDDRAEATRHYSTAYQIPPDLVELIYDTALRQGLDPELALRLVKVESNFTVYARSHANAYGLAQVQVATAKFYEPEITIEQLYDPATNLRIGFRFLRDLIEVYNNTELALLAYNRGPSRIKELLDAGHDPQNGYATRIMEGYGLAGGN